MHDAISIWLSFRRNVRQNASHFPPSATEIYHCYQDAFYAVRARWLTGVISLMIYRMGALIESLINDVITDIRWNYAIIAASIECIGFRFNIPNEVFKFYYQAASAILMTSRRRVRRQPPMANKVKWCQLGLNHWSFMSIRRNFLPALRISISIKIYALMLSQ